LSFWLGVAIALHTYACFAATQTRTVAFEYDATTGLVTKEIIEPDSSTYCVVTTYTYDAYGNKTAATTRNCNGSSSEAAAPTGDPVFTPRSASAALAAGSIVLGGTTYTWTAGQFATTNTNALSQSETRQFDPRFGATASLTGPNALTTQWSYDWLGRMTLETRADGTTTSWTYTRCVDNPGGCPTYGAYLVTETSTGAPTKTVYLDSLNREIRSEVQGFDGTAARKDTQYDTLRRVAQISKPYYAGQTIYWATFAYDVAGRVTDAVEPTTSAGTAKTHTDFNGLSTTVTVSNNGASTNMPGAAVQTKTTKNNSQGQVVQITDTQSNTVTYSYDPFGNLTQTNAAAIITSIAYDIRGRKTSMTDPNMGAWSYHYNALSELIRQTDAKSQTTSMTYDLLSRMVTRSEPNLNSTWTYDSCTKGIGKPCQASADNGYSRTQSYDSLGRPSTLSINIDTAYSMSRTYDSSGRIDTITYPTGFAVKNLYNSYGYPWKVQRTNDPDTTVYWQANSLTATGQVNSELLGNGLTTIRSYDAVFRMTGITSSNGGGAVHNHAYTFDAIGNVVQRQDVTQGVTENFAYDTLNRLLSASGPGLTTRSFDYSAIGNVTYKSDVGTYTYPGPTVALPHAVSTVSGSGNPYTVTASYGYDGNGNLTSASGTFYPASGSVTFSRTLTYMSFNMPSTLAHVQGGATYSYTYTYNTEHQRVKLVTVRPDNTLTSIYVHPAGKGALLYEKEMRQFDGLVQNKHYVNAGSALIGVFVTKSFYGTGEGPEMRYYLRDYAGSVAAIANPAAAVIERLGYEAYGERRYANGSPENRQSPLVGVTTDRGFTTHEHLDEMMLIHMKGRIFDPILGRFVTADPFVSNGVNLQNFNRYAYALNNPLKFVDPSGYNSAMIQLIDGRGGGDGGGGDGGGGDGGGGDVGESGGEAGGDGSGGESGSDETPRIESVASGSACPPGTVCITARRWCGDPLDGCWADPQSEPRFIPTRGEGAGSGTPGLGKPLMPPAQKPMPPAQKPSTCPGNGAIVVPQQPPYNPSLPSTPTDKIPADAVTVTAPDGSGSSARSPSAANVFGVTALTVTAIGGVVGGYVGFGLTAAEGLVGPVGGLIVADGIASGAMAGLVVGGAVGVVVAAGITVIYIAATASSPNPACP